MLVNKNSGVDCKCDLFRSMNTWPCTVCDTDILMPGVDTFICALTLPHLYSTDNLPHLCDLSSSLSHLPTLIHSFCTQHNLSFIPCQLIVYILYSTCQCLVKHAPTSLVKCLFELYIWKWEVLLLFPWQILANGLVVKDPTRHDTLFYPDVQHKMIILAYRHAINWGNKYFGYIMEDVRNDDRIFMMYVVGAWCINY